jgi:hypothetical protein
MEKNQRRIEASFLTNCTPQAAYDWLYERRIKDVYGHCENHDATLEYLLLRRREPLIDLGLARFAHSNKAITKVYDRGGTGIKCAALSNPHIGGTRCNLNFLGYGNLIVISAAWHGSSAELESLAKNVNLNTNLIEDILCRKGLFENKSDNDYIKLLVWLGKNPRMNTDYDKTGQNDHDGTASYHHDRIFYMAWDLLNKLPPTQEFAYALSELLSGTHIVGIKSEDVQKALDRWRIEENANNGKQNLSSSYFLRWRIADTVNVHNILLTNNTNDFALKESLYRRIPSNWTEWPSLVDLDGENAFTALIQNKNLWGDEKSRKKLENLALDESIDVQVSIERRINFIKYKKNMRQKYPHYFFEEDLPWSQSTDAIVKRIENKLECLSDNVAGIKDTTSQEFKYINKNKIDNNHDLLEKFKAAENLNYSRHKQLDEKIQGVTNELNKLISIVLQLSKTLKPAPNWLWFIVIILLIIILSINS